MLQVLQNLGNGATEVVEVPAPGVKSNHLRIRSLRSLVSVGTERMLVEFGKAGYIGKARQQPDKVRQTLDKLRTDGLMPTMEAVFAKLDQPLAMGYCNVGEVIEVGAGAAGFSVGDRVVSNGPHAEVVVVPKNLCARIPDGVSGDCAAFTVLGSIGLQGVRLLQPTLGERFVVMGLGVIGLLCVQILRANGCSVLGLDLDASKLELAKAMGAETFDLSKGDPLPVADAFSRGRGVDGVLICASTPSSEPVHNAAQMCRKRGRIVLVGVVGLELSRADFYDKELSFQVSCSYGPGRYDPFYEEQGNDYPVGFVRWTEQRNFEAVLDLMASGALSTDALVSHRYSISDAPTAYETLVKEKSLGILLEYKARSGEGVMLRKDVALPERKARPATGTTARVSFIGAGAFASRMLIPAFQKGGAVFQKICTSKGVSGVHTGRKFGFQSATTDLQSTFNDSDSDLIAIATQHDTHAAFTVSAMRAGKAVFVEKPLAVTESQLASVEAAYREASSPFVMVGFNRRFAPHIVKMKSLLDRTTPKAIVITVNSGFIPANHWTQDREAGGGRVIGEMCHFIDLARHLAGAEITSVQAVAAGRDGDARNLDDIVTVNFRFADGSIASVNYLSNGNRAFPKERVEVFQNGAILQLDNFRSLRGFGVRKFSKMSSSFQQDKGHNACAASTLAALRAGKEAPIPFAELLEVSRVTLQVQDMLSSHSDA